MGQHGRVGTRGAHVGFIKVHQGNGPVWVNTTHIVKVSAGVHGSILLTTATNDEGKSRTVVCREKLDDVMRLIEGAGEDIVRLPG